MTDDEKEDALLPFADQGFTDFAALVELLGEEWYEAAKSVMRRLHGDMPRIQEVRMSVTGQNRPWPYDGPEGRARLTGSLDTGESFTGDDDDDGDDYYAQSTMACCPRQTIPDSCSCLENCECMCPDCICGNWGEEYEDE